MVFQHWYAKSVIPGLRLVGIPTVNAGSRNAYSAEEREFKGNGSRFQNGDTLMARITPCRPMPSNGKGIATHCALVEFNISSILMQME